MSQAAPTPTKVDLSQQVNGKLAFVLHNVLTRAECQEVVAVAERVGFRDALVRTGFKELVRQPDHRRGQHCHLTDADLSAKLFARVSQFLPPCWRLGRLLSLNERLTVLRYGEGDFFGEHRDATYINAANTAISFITVQLYLNEEFEGGETALLPDGLLQASATPEAVASRRRVAVKPTTGSAFIFESKILHEGCTVRAGCKLSLRADVMYSRFLPHVRSDVQSDVHF